MDTLITEENQKIQIRLREWDQVGPENEPSLSGFTFRDPVVRKSGEQLTRAGQLEFYELPAGLTVRTNQYVGSIQLDNLRISILPKIVGIPLLNLLRYAYNLRKLDLFTPLDFGVEAGEFQDLLIQQLVVEIDELIQRGLNRKYERIEEDLQSPRGKIDFLSLSNQGGLVKASLPCIHFLRIQDNILNQVLLAGLNFAIVLTNDLLLRSHLRRTARILSSDVTKKNLTSQLMIKARSKLDRLTIAYQPALTIIQILLESQGVSIESTEHRANLPGFLFDMNRFFQALIEHFLKDNLQGYGVKAEYQLQDMISYDPVHNPQRKKSPTPRPDFAIMEGKKVKALLDTKYRDLWETDLPREMLYQLALYAFSQDRPGKSTIIYPTLHPEAKESWLDISHPLTGEKLATVKLRPINLYSLEQMIYKESSYKRYEFASSIVFGE